MDIEKLAMSDERFNSLTRETFKKEDIAGFIAYLLKNNLTTIDELLEWATKHKDETYTRKKMFNGIPKDF